jgi:hypothetical protein
MFFFLRKDLEGLALVNAKSSLKLMWQWNMGRDDISYYYMGVLKLNVFSMSPHHNYQLIVQ